MCTIGVIINKETTTFKNCDLDKDTKFFEPEIRKGKFKYIAFGRSNRPGIYAGINEAGLSIVAADTYTQKIYKAKPHTINKIFKIYEDAIAENGTLHDVVKYLKSAFSIIEIPDMIIVSDKVESAVFEYTPFNKFGIKYCKSGSIFRTNQFKILAGGLPRAEDEESYKRYENCELLMKKHVDIKEILKSHKDGPSEFSICRHGHTGKFKTMASIIMVAGREISASYIINNSPCKKEYRRIKLM